MVGIEEPMITKTVSLLFALTLPLAHADDPRMSEASMFGAPATPATATKVEPTTMTQAIKNAFDSGEVKDNPLQIGGLLYQRFSLSSKKDVAGKDTPVTMPMQFDLFLDARPSDRVRGYIDERILYDSTRDAYGNPTKGGSASSLQFSSGSTAPTAAGVSTVPTNPQTVLDQAWLKFDMERTVFVTVGKQHLKWGTSRFWNPTDFLNGQTRDPLLPYDLRLGTTMLKLDIPLESQRMNLYAITLFDNPQPASTLGQMGEAVRVEKMIGNAEIGADAVFRGGISPIYGLDFSSPLGPFDVYGEAAYMTSTSAPHYRLTSAPTTGADLSTLYSEREMHGPIYQVSGGLNYSFGWKTNRLATAGVEYFYNDEGYDESSAYPVLILLGRYKGFYTGRNYAAIYLTAEGPDESKHTSYTFSTLGNLSDSSYISRLDFNWNFLTYVTFGAYYAQHYGRKGGEFNFALNTPALTYQTAPVPAVNVPQTVFDLGMSLRVAF